MSEKRFYWIKLKTDFFNQETIDYILSQTNGCEYIVLYQMICLQTANNNGKLSTNIGEMIIPFDVDKIVRDTKYFNKDTVIVALELFKKLGLIYQDDNGVLSITGYDNMVGSETKAAERQRLHRSKQQKALTMCDNVTTMSHDMSQNNCDIVAVEIEKDIEKEIDIEKEKKKTKKEKPVKHKYGEYNNVLLSDTELEKLKAEFPNDYQSRIERLSSYMQSTGKSYKDHLATIRNWARRDNKNGNGGYYQQYNAPQAEQPKKHREIDLDNLPF